MKPKDRLAKWMAKNGYTQADVATFAGVSQQSVSRWLAGARDFSVEAALRLERASGGELTLALLVPRMKCA